MTSKTATCGAQYSYFIYQSWWNVLFVIIFDFKWWLFFCNSINMEWNWPRISTGHEASKTKWLVKILAKFRYYFEGEEKMSRPFPSWLGFKSRCSYHDKLLCGLKQYCYGLAVLRKSPLGMTAFSLLLHWKLCNCSALCFYRCLLKLQGPAGAITASATRMAPLNIQTWPLTSATVPVQSGERTVYNT